MTHVSYKCFNCGLVFCECHDIVETKEHIFCSVNCMNEKKKQKVTI